MIKTINFLRFFFKFYLLGFYVVDSYYLSMSLSEVTQEHEFKEIH